jgi:hypothetical protein
LAIRSRAARSAAGPLLVLALAACSTSRGLPPFWEHEEGLPGELTEDSAVFYLVSRTRGEDGALLSAIRPFAARAEDGKGAEKLAVLPPIVGRVEGEQGEVTRSWPVFWDSLFGDETERKEHRSDDDTTIFPILAWGSEPDQGSYFAAFPLYGTLKGRLLSDRIDFVAFPLYASTQTGDWHSTHLIWPLVCWGESPTRSHFRIMPFWSQTDSKRFHNRTLLWPIVRWGTEVRGERTFDSWFVFPLIGHRGSADDTYSAWTFLYPFFEFAHDDVTGDTYRGILFPIHKYSLRVGESESLWWWPAYGTYDSDTEHSTFYAWPLVWITEDIRGGREFRRRYVVPFWMRRESGPAGGPMEDRELRSWPFFSWRERPDGYQSLRVPEIIPFFGWEAGETCYADIVTVFKWRSDRAGREAWDGPLSIVRYRRDDKGAKTLTLLWWIDIPVGDGR